MKFHIGVIGATGFIGTPYRKEIREAADSARIVALCARRRDRLEAAAKEDGAALVTDNWREVVEHPDVNLVLVATPDRLHHEAVMACAEQGKHVVCEKPVGNDAHEAYQMWSAYRERKLGHYVPFWSRYIEVFDRARSVVQEGTLGELRAMVFRWHNPRPASMPFTWRDDGELSSAGSVGDVGSHVYDTIRWVTGLEAQRVLAHADVITPAKPDLGAVDLGEALDWGRTHASGESKNTRKGTAFDYGNIAVQFENGAVGSIVVSHAPYLRKGLAPEMELHGSQASLSVDRTTGLVRLAHPDQEVATVDTRPHKEFPNRFANYVFPGLHQQIEDTPCDHPSLYDGWRVQLFTDAAALSAQRGTWVDLAELDDER